MKKIFLPTLLVLLLLSSANAKSNTYMDKIVKLWSLKTNGEVDFNTTKTEDGYNLVISSKNKVFSTLVSKKPIKISVDEGPLITTPSFALGTASLSAKGNMLDIFSKELVGDINKSTLKSEPKFTFEGKVGFSDNYTSTLTIEPLEVNESDFTLKVSKIVDTGSYDLNSFTGKDSIKVDTISIVPKKEKGHLKISGVSLNINVPQEPIENYMLFSNTTLELKKLDFSATNRSGKQMHSNLYAKVSGETKRVDANLLDAKFSLNTKALDADTIARAQGIKDLNLDFELKSLGIKGFVELLKLNKQMQKANQELVEASNKGDDVAMQKAILKSQEFVQKMVPIWNNTFIKDKSKLVLDLNLKSDKTSYVKLDLVYKGEPISGNVQSAMISLMAQQLKLLDGTFDIAVDSQLASTINPFAIMGLDMLKSKGFATNKNGVYSLKGELKGGKIILNGKAYTLPELTKALF